jgi:hypothetical protein
MVILSKTPNDTSDTSLIHGWRWISIWGGYGPHVLPHGVKNGCVGMCQCQELDPTMLRAREDVAVSSMITAALRCKLTLSTLSTHV